MSNPVSIVTNEDNMAMMSRYPDKFFDLAIVDPPYGIKQDGRNNHTRGKLAKSKDYSRSVRYDDGSPGLDYFDELFRVSKNQVIFGANHFISKIPLDSPAWIVWDKQNGDTDFADCELAWTSFSTSVRKFTFRWQGMLQGDMKNKEDRLHPNQKPASLYKWILHTYAKIGNKLLDTHMGSQSSRIAAWDMKFDYYGCELDKEYFDAGCKRFNIHAAQLRFDL